MIRYQLLLGPLLTLLAALGLSCAPAGPSVLDESSLQHLRESKRVGLKWKSTGDDYIPLELTRYVLSKQGIDVYAAKKEGPGLDAILIMGDWSTSDWRESGTREFKESFENLSRRQKSLQDFPPEIEYKTSLTVKIEGHKVYKREFKCKRVQPGESSGGSTQELLVYCLMDIVAQVRGLSAVLSCLESDSTPVWRGTCEYLAEDNNILRAAADNAILIRSASLRLFDSPVTDRRVFAARILSRFDDSIAVGKLVVGLADTEFTVQKACRGALMRITSQDFGYDVDGWMDWLGTRKNPTSQLQ